MPRRLFALLAGFGVSAALVVPTAAVGSAATHAAPIAVPQKGTDLATAHVRLQTYATGLTSPVALAWRAGQASPVYVADQTGTLVTVGNGHVTGTALKLTVAQGNEQGLLGIAFSNDGKKLYVDYNDVNGDLHIVEYTMKGNVANKATRRQLLMIPHHTFSNHNGGNLVIGPDNMLYISVGDGGSGGDPNGNGQNTNVLLAKILRIDPRANGAASYRIPTDNPFKGKAGKRGEIWMYGLRNPWRFSIDSKTHDMWIGDVGQDLYEEVDYAPAGQKGINWGWNKREGFHPYNGGAKPAGARDPILERPHTDGDCAIIGGYVYRGSPTVPLVGAYVFGDECTGELRAMVQKGGHVVQSADLDLNVSQLTTFGQGPKGALYAVSRDGTIYLIAPA